MKSTTLSAALVSLLVLSGCGAGEEDEAKTAISGYLMEQQDQAQMITLKKSEADCIAGDMVDGIGVDSLKEYGFLNEDGTVNKDSAKTPEMSKEDSEVMVDAMFGCTDVMDTMRDELAKAMGSATPEMQDCFEEALSEETVRKVLVATFSGDEQTAQQELMEPLGKCITGGMGLPGDSGGSDK
jgi:hypothetical protein